MEKQRNSKLFIIIALILVVIGITVAFAILSTTLNINGTAKLEASTWEVKFVGPLAPALVGTADVIVAPSLEDTSVGTYDVVLKSPGDSVTYTFDVTNTGTLPAKIGTFTKEVTPTFTGLAFEPEKKAADEALAESYVSYTLKYTATGEEVAKEDKLAPEETKNLTLTLEYSSSATETPTADVEITDLGIDIIYVQDMNP